ncbi:hypothetical protein BMF94_4354 [Rhodotorula taiwanensis]|uniref:UBC core domain-containing protein n=1 Tax=Rhodotorula taiwanensis TaxID=741276 RepID=A0A2S5B6Y8_9BASI|nr:hypothetical protein BMF94_4354 [Rhodotorula taiwanensis]
MAQGTLPQDHPYGFWAKPKKAADGTLDMKTWETGIPGREGTIWEGATYPVTLLFPDGKFPANFYHPNIYPSGTVCLSILNEEKSWRPAITILLGIQDLLDAPNADDPAQLEAYTTFKYGLFFFAGPILRSADIQDVHRKDRSAYEKRVKQQAKDYIPK